MMIKKNLKSKSKSQVTYLDLLAVQALTSDAPKVSLQTHDNVSHYHIKTLSLLFHLFLYFPLNLSRPDFTELTAKLNSS